MKMKITKSRLKRIIKEELNRTNEASQFAYDPESPDEPTERADIQGAPEAALEEMADLVSRLDTLQRDPSAVVSIVLDMKNVLSRYRG